MQSCGVCPIINSGYCYDVTWLMIKIKHYVAKRVNLYGLTWTEECEMNMKSSSVFRGLPIIRVPLFLTKLPNMHKPSSNEVVRLRLSMSIQPDDFVLLICAPNLKAESKGIPDIVDAIDIALHDGKLGNNIVILTAGRGNLPHNPGAKRVIEMGHLSHDELYQAYWLSDLYVSASKEDVGPGTLAYAFACGIPVISYNTGIAPVLIDSGNNGYIVNVGNVNELSQGIVNYYYLDTETKKKWSENVALRAQLFFDGSWAINLVRAINED